MTQQDLGRLLFGVYDVAAKVQQHCKPGLGWAPCGSGPSSQAGERAYATRDPHARRMSSRSQAAWTLLPDVVAVLRAPMGPGS